MCRVCKCSECLINIISQCFSSIGISFLHFLFGNNAIPHQSGKGWTPQLTQPATTGISRLGWALPPTSSTPPPSPRHLSPPIRSPSRRQMRLITLNQRVVRNKSVSTEIRSSTVSSPVANFSPTYLRKWRKF